MIDLERLSPREKLALAIGAAAVVVTIVVAGIILPWRAADRRLDERIASRQAQIGEARTLVQKIRGMQGEVAVTSRRLGAGQAKPLTSTLESLVARIAAKENLLAVRPQPATAPSGFRQEKVEMQLERVRLDQIVRLLHAIDSNETMLQTDSVKLRPRFEDPALLDATLVVSAFVKAS